MTERFFSTKAELDLLHIQLHLPTSTDGGSSTPATGGGSAAARGAAGTELLRTYLSRIADLENEVKSLRSLQQLTGRRRDSHGGGGGSHPAASLTVRD